MSLGISLILYLAASHRFGIISSGLVDIALIPRYFDLYSRIAIALEDTNNHFLFHGFKAFQNTVLSMMPVKIAACDYHQDGLGFKQSLTKFREFHFTAVAWMHEMSTRRVCG